MTWVLPAAVGGLLVLVGLAVFVGGRLRARRRYDEPYRRWMR